MIASPALLAPDRPEVDDKALANAARRGTAVPAPAPRRAGGPSPDAADGAALLDYAAFVLEQEAEYCQQ